MIENEETIKGILESLRREEETSSDTDDEEEEDLDIDEG